VRQHPDVASGGAASLIRPQLGPRFQTRVLSPGHIKTSAVLVLNSRARRPVHEEFIAADRMLLANASHELRTPLSRIQLGIELPSLTGRALT